MRPVERPIECVAPYMMGKLASLRSPKFIDPAGDDQIEGGNVVLPGEGEPLHRLNASRRLSITASSLSRGVGGGATRSRLIPTTSPSWSQIKGSGEHAKANPKSQGKGKSDPKIIPALRMSSSSRFLLFLGIRDLLVHILQSFRFDSRRGRR